MSEKLTISFSESKKYQQQGHNFQGSLMMVDLVSALMEKLHDFGELKTFKGHLTDGGSVQVLSIPEILSIKIRENHDTQSIDMEYQLMEENHEIKEAIEDVRVSFL